MPSDYVVMYRPYRRQVSSATTLGYRSGNGRGWRGVAILTDVLALMTVLLCLGVLLVAGALLFLAVRFSRQWALLTLRRHPPAAIGDVLSRGRGAVEGRTEYGPAGRQTGPVSGQDCTWYRVTLVREPHRGLGTGDGTDHDVLLDLSSPDWPALADPTGRIAVDPRMLDLPGRQEPLATEAVRLTDPASMPPVVPRDVIDDLRPGERLTLSEVRLPRGRPIFALGRPADGVLAPGRGTLSIFTTDSRAKVLADRAEDVKVALGAALVMLLTGAALTGGSVAALNHVG
jgi:hypothetical protein